MIGLVLVTHGRLADEFKAALEHVMGPQKQIEAITIGAEDDSDLCRSDIIEAVNRVDSGDGVAILTDMFGGTPVEPRDFLHEPPEGRSARGHQPAHAGQARQGARGALRCPTRSRWPRKPAANTSPSPAGCSPANERRARHEAGTGVPAGAISKELLIINKRGLHARASAKFVQTVERFNAQCG